MPELPDVTVYLEALAALIPALDERLLDPARWPL